MTNLLYDKDIISMQDLNLDQIKLILKTAEQFKKKAPGNLLKNKLIAHCFFEPSTRTRLSFETATLRLGGQVIGFADADVSSNKKGETLQDSIRIIASYADLIVIRHPQEGSARLAAEVSDKPVVNAGDGANQHPTQALLDVFTILEYQKKLDGLSIGLVGDLKYGRTIHSLAQLLTWFNVRLFLVAPEALTLPTNVFDELKKKGIRCSFHESLEEIIQKVDVLYITRIQKERFDADDYQRVKDKCILKKSMLDKAKDNLTILHPLPRVDELDPEIDQSDHAKYFEQAANGICVREAILSLILNKEI